MPITTRPTPSFDSFETIDITALRDVQGGCGKKQCSCPAPAPAIAAPAPAPAPMSEISTSVSISYQ